MRWFWPREITLRLGQAFVESIWLHGLLVVVAAMAPTAIEVGYLRLAALPSVIVLLVAVCKAIPGRFLLNRLLLVPASVAIAVVWLQLALAPDEPWTLGALLHSAIAPWSSRFHGGPFVILLWLSALYLAVRGLVIGAFPQTAGGVSRWFVGGAAVFVALFAVTAWTSVPSAQLPMGELRGLVIEYFVAGLVLIALVHRRSIQTRAGLLPRLSPAWAIAVAVPVIFVLVSGAALASGRQGLRTAIELSVSLVAWTYRGLVWSVALLWQGVLWIWYWVLLLYRWITSLLPAGSSESGSTTDPSWLPKAPPLWEISASVALPPMTDSLPYVAAVLLFALAVLVARALSRAASRREAAAVEEESESMWSWSLFRWQLLDLWNGLVSRWRVRRDALLNPLFARMTEGALPLEDMRQIYRALLAWAARRGKVRSPGTTPFEFAGQLKAGSEYAHPIDELTQCYARNRYGREEIGDSQLQRLRDSVRDLSAPAVERS